MEISKGLEDLEISLLLEAIYQRFGDDIRGYGREALRAKLRGFMRLHEIPTVSSLQNLVLHHPGYKEALLRSLDGRETALFEHPEHFLALRNTLVPWLRSSPAPKVWIADCVAAEDVFGIAILLQEEDLQHKTRIFATSNNVLLLNEAREGRFALEKSAAYKQNYLQAGGRNLLSNYYQQIGGDAVFHKDLAKNITWAQYNLGTDSSFNEFELIICRGGLTDYASRLRRRALQIFYESQPMFGLLNLPNADYAEVVRTMPFYQVISSKVGIYRRVK